MTVRICPSILNADRENIFEEITRVETSDWLHLDIMDNVFVPNQTFSKQESLEIIRFSKIPVDSHLMISTPDVDAVEYAQMGSASVTFHLEASLQPTQTLQAIKSNGARASLAIKPKTPFRDVAPLLPLLDMLLIMTVEPGFGGQSFMVDQIPKIQEAYEAIRRLPGAKPWIQVDGGVSLETISLAAKAGADSFVAGSAIYKAEDPVAMITALREAAEINSIKSIKIAP